MVNLDHIKIGIDEYFERLEIEYPNRHKEIHKDCCKGCPSASGHDPLSLDIKNSCSKELIALEYAFVCYKRESKLCKGYCDLNDIDQKFLDKLHGKEV